jgi:uncharacterized protein (TIRG00374 family)
MSSKKYLWLVAKLAVTAVLLWLLFRKVDLAPVAERLGSSHGGWAVVVVVVTLAQLLLTGARWFLVGRCLGLLAPLRECLQLVLIGQFFNQILPSSIGGDGVRAWILARRGYPLRRVLSSIISDRVAALAVLGSIVALTLPLLKGKGVPSMDILAWLIPSIALASLLTLYFAGQSIAGLLSSVRVLSALGSLVRDVRMVIFGGIGSLGIVGIAVVVQVLGVVIVHLCARCLGLELNMQAWLLIPMILLVSMVPVSFAGWGVRESAMVVGLGAAGIAAPDALAISVLYGLTQIVVGLPGSILMLSARGRRTASGALRGQALDSEEIETNTGDRTS